jgi:hypothetical protein
LDFALGEYLRWAVEGLLRRKIFAARIFACLLVFFSLPALAQEKQIYAGSAVCAGCHQAEYKSWHDSHHGWALREPTAANVLGDFHDTQFTNKNVTTHFSEAGGEYFVETDGPDGRMTKYKIAYTVGVWPLQQYLVKTGNGMSIARPGIIFIPRAR